MVCPRARICTLYKDNGTEPSADQEPHPAKSDQVFELVVTSIGEGVLVEVAIMERSTNHYPTPEVHSSLCLRLWPSPA